MAENQAEAMPECRGSAIADDGDESVADSGSNGGTSDCGRNGTANLSNARAGSGSSRGTEYGRDGRSHCFCNCGAEGVKICGGDCESDSQPNSERSYQVETLADYGRKHVPNYGPRDHRAGF